MSDYNVVIREVDVAMDMLESIEKEVQDVRAHATFDVSSLIALVSQKIIDYRQEIEDYNNECVNRNDESVNYENETDTQLCRLEEQLSKLLSIKSSCEGYGTELIEQLNDMCRGASELVDAGLCEMGRYISKLNRISGIEQSSSGNFSKDGCYTYVCVIDSSRYPQTAEHIRTAQNMGLPSVLTIDREKAADRRKASLEGVRMNKLYDRDEYPCAVFQEGGSGADVVYIEGSDNRGAGSHMRWQMNNMPDGSQVRIRVV